MSLIRNIYSKIKSKVEGIINFYSSNDPRRISEFLGIHILKSNLGNVEGFLQYYNHTYIIHINSNITDETTQDKIIAHELGHYFLHKHLNIFCVDMHTLAFEATLENEANIFATELLLNDSMLKEELPFIQNMNIYELSSYFNLDFDIVKMKYDLFFLNEKEHTFAKDNMYY
ncbi:ImmA/IrrE family metallo-endopeptidase [Enterococcus faecalis]|nr:ImmA/IrrE family metallo-endopeptidase [Enterococcus faecalis]